MIFRGWERWGPATGIVAAVVFVVGLIVSGNNSDTGRPDHTIVSHYAKHSNQFWRPRAAVLATPVQTAP